MKVEVVIELRKLYRVEVEAETLSSKDLAIEDVFMSGEWGEEVDMQSEIYSLTRIGDET